MKYKYILLSAGRGIVIYLEMEELLDSKVNSSDVKIADKLYLRVSDGIFPKDMATPFEYWIVGGIKSLSDRIREEREGLLICYHIISLEFNPAHFQEEGLYYAVQGWIGQRYGFDIPQANIEFDRKNNRYKFNFPT